MDAHTRAAMAKAFSDPISRRSTDTGGLVFRLMVGTGGGGGFMDQVGDESWAVSGTPLHYDAEVGLSPSARTEVDGAQTGSRRATATISARGTGSTAQEIADALALYRHDPAEQTTRYRPEVYFNATLDANNALVGGTLVEVQEVTPDPLAQVVRLIFTVPEGVAL